VVQPSSDADSAAAATAPHVRALLLIAASATVLVGVVYVLAVRSTWGQHLDRTAVAGRHVLTPENIRAAGALHRSIDVASLALLGGGIALIALLRGRRRLAFGAGIVIAGSLSTTEILKRVLDRPNLGVTDALRHAQSYPSGHTTIAMALAIGAIFVSPRRWRATVAVLGAGFASLVGCSVVATASHRPSDAIGAALVATAWAAAVAAALLRSDEDRPRPATTRLRLAPWMALGGIVLLGAAFVATSMTVVAIHYGRVGTIEFGRAFVAAGSAIVGTILLCTAVLLIALHDIDLGRPSPRKDGAASRGLDAQPRSSATLTSAISPSTMRYARRTGAWSRSDTIG
jgi:membrane-associated phospholipid phosphatase